MVRSTGALGTTEETHRRVAAWRWGRQVGDPQESSIHSEGAEGPH